MRWKPWRITGLVVWALAQCISALAQGAPQPSQQVLRIGAEDDWAPFSSAKNGVPVGMAVDLVQAIFAEAGMPIQLVALPYKRCMEEAKLGRIAGCFDTLPDDQLRKDYWFHTQPLFSDPILILARADDPVMRRDLAGLEGKKVIVTHGYTYGDAFEANRTIQRVSASHDINALRMLHAKRGDYALVYQRITNVLLQGDAKALQGQIKPVGTLTQANLFIAFSRRYPGMERIVQRFDAAHARLLKNQAISRIEKRWN